MLKRSILIFSLFVVLSLNTAFAEGLMLFVGDGCSHCAAVEKYLKDNNVSAKLPITVYEVWYNKDNAALYTQKASEVGYTDGYVPLLIDGGRYVDGDTPIIDYIDGLLKDASPITNANPVNDGNVESVADDTVPKTSDTLTKEDQDALKNILNDDASTEKYGSFVTKNKTYLIIAGVAIIVLVGFEVSMKRKKRK